MFKIHDDKVYFVAETPNITIRSLTASSQNWCLKRVCTSTTRNAVAIM